VESSRRRIPQTLRQGGTRAEGVSHEAWIRRLSTTDQNASLQIAEPIAEGMKEKYIVVDEVSGRRKPGNGRR
jgi:hypothetical protein